LDFGTTVDVVDDEFVVEWAVVVVVGPGLEALVDLRVTKVAPTKRTRIMRTTSRDGW
jgi:hypothetical protein